MRAPISLCIITKNNAAQLGVLLRLVRDYVAQICVVDTGSTDATPAIARAIADRFEVFTACNDVKGRIIDFSLARRRSFDLATEETILWCDTDDEIAGIENLAAEIDFLKRLRTQVGKPTILQYDYRYAGNAAGTTVLHNRERLLLREDWLSGAFCWENRVHELLTPVSEAAIVRAPRSTMAWIHNQSVSTGREPNRDLRILQYALDEEGGLAKASLRTIYCLAGEYLQRQRYEESREVCVAYLDRPGARVERTLLLGYIAKSHLAEGNFETALTYALDAFGNAQGDAPGGVDNPGGAKDPAFTAGLVYKASAETTTDPERRVHALRAAVKFFRLGLGLPDARVSSSFPQSALTARLGLVECLRALEKPEEALAVTEEALAIVPNAGQFLKHRGELNLLTTKNRIVQSIACLHEWGGVSDGDVAGLAGILNTAPNVAVNIPSLSQSLRMAEPELQERKLRERRGGLDILLACGDTREPWNPRRVEEVGVGGSEIAACDWARGMVARGHRVRVFTGCGEPEVYNEVEYLPTAALHGARGDVAVAWRFPALLSHVHASRTFLWAHDASLPGIQCGTRVVAFSRWHKEVLVRQHELCPDDVCVIDGAIRVEDFADGGTTERRPQAAVCLSAHERHLLAFMDLWPRIRAAVPDATLDLFYGYDEWKRLPVNAVFAELIKYFDRKRPMLEAMGVTFHPRLPRKEIAHHLLSASVWLYPTAWSECWPAVAAQAQAAGLYSVTTDLAALPEMFEGNFCNLIRGEGSPHGWNLEPGYQERFVNQAVAALRYPLFEDARRALHHNATKRFGWARYLDAWEELFRAPKLADFPLNR
jgi:glycosyltransferase involved in cell wall biosynthesis